MPSVSGFAVISSLRVVAMMLPQKGNVDRLRAPGAIRSRLMSLGGTFVHSKPSLPAISTLSANNHFLDLGLTLETLKHRLQSLLQTTEFVASRPTLVEVCAMKSIIRAAVIASALVMPVASFAQSAAHTTRVQVRAELAQ